MSLSLLKNTVRWLMATNTRRGVTAIIMAVFFANSLYILGISNYDALGWTSNLTTVSCHLLCGNPAIDPNTGWLTTDLGHRAALDILHGHWPWWNQFEGLGSPLAGEMQAGALSPFVLFLALPNGLLFMHLSFELIAGLGTYFWIRRLGVSNFAATVAGVLFALNATFAWVGNATLNPIAFLPIGLLGVELLVGTASRRRHLWWVLGLAVALSILAGFPEVALFDTVFIGLYAVVRAYGVQKEFRLRYAATLLLGFFIGLVVSSPALVSFKDFSAEALVGMHGTGQSATIGLPLHALPMFLSPYSFGPFFQVPVATPMWSFIGGYFGVTLFALAVYGTFGKKLRSLRLTLMAYVVLAFPAIMGVTPVRDVWNLIPFVSQSLLDRYIMPSVEMALIVVAVLALDDLRDMVIRRRAIGVTFLTGILLIAGTIEAALTRNYSPLPRSSVIEEIIGRSLPFVIFLALAVVFFRGSNRTSKSLGLIVIVEMTMCFLIPTLWAPASITADLAPIQYLRGHLGYERFTTLGPIAPNWGSYFGISELNEVDLPFPHQFAHEIKTSLVPGESQSVNQFFMESGVSKPSFFVDAFAKNIAEYERLSVKYVVVSTSMQLTQRFESLHLPQVFRDAQVTIYALPGPTPYFSTWNRACRIETTSFTSARVTCAAGTTLTRDELALNGWSATVNGSPVPIIRTPLLQSVRVPAGTSVVSFSYSPKHEKLSLALCALGIFGAFAFALYDRRRNPRNDSPQSSV